MAEVLVQFDTVMRAPDGRWFVPRACGRKAGHVWEGWIEFAPADHSPSAIRTARETVQPNRTDLMYWATGLTRIFLEGALGRALAGPVYIERERPLHPYFEGPGPSIVVADRRPVQPHPVLDPFETYFQGHDVLAKELGALDTARLRDIVLAYDFADQGQAESAAREELTAMILTGVRRPLAGAAAGAAAAGPQRAKGEGRAER